MKKIPDPGKFSVSPLYKRASVKLMHMGLLTPEEQEAEEKRLAHNREWQKEWREKRKASEPEKPPKQKSIKELMAVEKTGADLHMHQLF